MRPLPLHHAFFELLAEIRFLTKLKPHAEISGTGNGRDKRATLFRSEFGFCLVKDGENQRIQHYHVVSWSSSQRCSIKGRGDVPLVKGGEDILAQVSSPNNPPHQTCVIFSKIIYMLPYALFQLLCEPLISSENTETAGLQCHNNTSSRVSVWN